MINQKKENIQKDDAKENPLVVILLKMSAQSKPCVIVNCNFYITHFDKSAE